MNKSDLKLLLQKFLGGVFVSALTVIAIYNILYGTNTIYNEDKISYYDSTTEVNSLTLVVNINTANSHELRKLSGIGNAKAKAIIEYREEHGYFSSVDELLNVSGIGEATLENIRSNVTI